MISNTSYITSACTIYCQGPVLQTIQLSGIFNDSKTFVDMPMIYSPEITMNAFNAIPDLSNITALEVFLNDYFLPVGSDLDSWVPTDYTENPAILDRITDPEYKAWASDLNGLWLVLGRQVNQSVIENPSQHSFLPYNYPMMVPGGRYRESYYWDSWWIVRGLLVCDMYETALYEINNLLDDIANFGFVPNGGRIYYLDRSQPPVLSEMILNYYEYMEEKFGVTSSLESFMTGAYASLQTEYAWWMNPDNGHVVTMPDGSILNRYHSNYTDPRPESFVEDYVNTSIPGNTVEYAHFYDQNKRAGAETGWDYSSRWISGQYNISAIDAIDIVPIDLNAILFRMERNLVVIGGIVNSFSARRKLRGGEPTLASSDAPTPEATNYTAAAIARYGAIQTYLWDEERYHWWDWNITTQSWNMLGSTNGSAVSIASWIPLWAGILPTETGETYADIANKLVTSLQNSDLIEVAGVRTTTLYTEQQWDSPNAWAPLVWFTIAGLQKLNTVQSINLADTIINRWLNTCMIAYDNTGYMYEKYNAFEIGVGGGGGEYVPQIGFGWSNAVALMLLDQMYPTTTDDDYSDDSSSGGIAGWAVALIVLSVLGVIFGTSYFCYFSGSKERTFHTTAEVRRAEPANALVIQIATPMEPETTTSAIHQQENAAM